MFNGLRLSLHSDCFGAEEVQATRARPFWERACLPRAHSIHPRPQPREHQRLSFSSWWRHQWRKSLRNYKKARKKGIRVTFSYNTAILSQDLPGVCFFFLIRREYLNARKLKSRATSTDKILKVNTSLDKRAREINIILRNNNGHDRRGYSDCCRRHFSSPPAWQRE